MASKNTHKPAQEPTGPQTRTAIVVNNFAPGITTRLRDLAQLQGIAIESAQQAERVMRGQHAVADSKKREILDIIGSVLKDAGHNPNEWEINIGPDFTELWAFPKVKADTNE